MNAPKLVSAWVSMRDGLKPWDSVSNRSTGRVTDVMSEQLNAATTLRLLACRETTYNTCWALLQNCDFGIRETRVRRAPRAEERSTTNPSCLFERR